ncbi:MAG: hypothetical protein KF836_11960 [Fimbriimonadaceae bacterium]|nr:hypothetical protein [Fimbriimonadaceae bacterium]
MKAFELAQDLLQIWDAGESPFSDRTSPAADEICRQLIQDTEIRGLMSDFANSMRFSSGELGFIYCSLLLVSTGYPPKYKVATDFVEKLKSIESNPLYPWVIRELFTVIDIFDLRIPESLLNYIAQTSGKLPNLGSNQWDDVIHRCKMIVDRGLDERYGLIATNLERIN